MVVRISFRELLIAKVIIMIGATMLVISALLIPLAMKTNMLPLTLALEWGILSTMTTMGIAYCWYMWDRVPLSETGGLSARDWENHLSYTKGYHDGKTLGVMVASTEFELYEQKFHETKNQYLESVIVRVFPLETEIGKVINLVA